MGEANALRRSILVNTVRVVYLLILGVAIFIASSSLDLDEVRRTAIGGGEISMAVLADLANRFWMVLVFVVVLGLPRGGKWTNSFFLVLPVFGRAWLTRYFPISGAWLVHRLALARRVGVSKTQMATSSALESMTQFFGMSLLAFFFVVLNPGGVTDPRALLWAGGAGVVLFIGAGSPPILRLGLRLLSSLRGGPDLTSNLPSFRTYFVIASGQLVTAVLSGVGAVIVVSGVVGVLSVEKVFFVIGLVALSNVVSVLAFFAPAGIGVREAVLIFGLAQLGSYEAAVAMAITLRVVSLIADVVFFGLSQVPTVVARRRNTGATD